MTINNLIARLSNLSDEHKEREISTVFDFAIDDEPSLLSFQFANEHIDNDGCVSLQAYADELKEAGWKKEEIVGGLGLFLLFVKEQEEKTDDNAE